jgi:hypothetical protein
MSKRREIRCYDYVNHPYEHVRDPFEAGSTHCLPGSYEGGRFPGAIDRC